MGSAVIESERAPLTAVLGQYHLHGVLLCAGNQRCACNDEWCLRVGVEEADGQVVWTLGIWYFELQAHHELVPRQINSCIWSGCCWWWWEEDDAVQQHVANIQVGLQLVLPSSGSHPVAAHRDGMRE